MFLKRKKKAPIKDSARYGFSFADRPLTQCSDRVLSCAVKGLFIFAAVYGSLGGLISSFDLPCYSLVLPLILLAISMAMAFLHYSRLIFNIFYPITFLFFMFSIVSYRYYVYSGFQAFLNIMQEKYSTYFNLSILREANEYFTNRHMTITIAAVFIGFFLIVLLNIAISEYMSLSATILLTFPIFQLGIYIDEMPDFPYLILLLFAYFMIAILKRSGHFLLPYREKEFTEFSLKTRPGIRTWRYHASGRMMLQLTGVFFTFSLLLGIFCMPFLATSSNSVRPSDLRQKVDEYMKVLTQNGLSGFFDRYEASGGLSEGRLGGVSSVRPDYETDLTVTFVPFAYEPMYLRAYVGQEYDGSSWQAPSYNVMALQTELGVNYEDYENYTAFLESRRLAHYTEKNPGKGVHGKIRIQNVDANENHLYLPYYTTSEITAPYHVIRGVADAPFLIDSSYTAEYYPLMHDYWQISAQPDEMLADMDPASLSARYIAYYDMINSSSYINMPPSTREGLEEIKNEIGTAANLDAQIGAIQKYLHENYTYSMMPGTTPRNADFALHFLLKQDSGYCAHFATAATLLLRSYGIPARYVEGYAISLTDVAEGTALDEAYEDWFHGENPIGETGVVSVNVTDASAHAWVEVYKIGIGWVPYEFTPPSTEEEEQENAYSDFWSIFSGIFGGNPPPETVSDIATQQDTDSVFKKIFQSSSFLAKPLLLFVGAILLIAFVVLLFFSLTKRLQMTNAYRRGDYAPLLAHYYRNLCLELRRKKYMTGDFLLPTELPTDLAAFNEKAARKSRTFSFTSEECSLQMQLLEKCCYSQHQLSSTQADALLQFLKKYKKAIKKT